MKTVVIFGGSGFVGNHLTRRLAKNGYRIIIPYQKQANESKLRLFGVTGQIIPIRFKSLNEDKIINILKKTDVLINLKTQWNEKIISFDKGILDFNIKLINILKNCERNPLFIFFSGVGIEKDKISRRSLAIYKSETYILKNVQNSVIIKPSIILGAEDKFLNSLLNIFRFSIIIPLFGRGNNQFQPIYIDDVSLGVEKIVKKSIKGNNIFEFVGSEIFTYYDFYLLIASFIKSPRKIARIPYGLCYFFIALLEKTSFSPINTEQLKLFKSDNIATNLYKNISDLGIFTNDIKEIVKNSVKKNL